MKIFSICLLQLVTLPGLFAGEINFTDLINLALKENNQLKILDNQQYISKLSTYQSFRDLYLPKLSWNLTAKQTRIDDGPMSEPIANQSLYSEDKTYQSQAILGLNLFSGFSDYFNHRYFLSKYESSRVKKLEGKRSLVFSLRDLYLSISLEKIRLKIAEDEFQRDDKVHRQAKIKFRKGLISRSDLHRSKIQKLSSQDQLDEQKNKIVNLRLKIKNLIGQDKNLSGKITPFDFKTIEEDLLKTINDVEKNGLETMVENYFQSSLRSGSQLSLAKLDRDQKRFLRSKSLANFSPKLSFTLQHNYYFEQGFTERSETQRDEVVALLTLTIPLFNSFDTMISYKKERLALLSSKYQYSQKFLEIKNELRSLFNNLLQQYKSFKTLLENYNLQSYVYKTSLKRFNIGAITVKDLIEDKIDLQRVSYQLADAGYSLRILSLKIDKLSGNIDSYGRIL